MKNSKQLLTTILTLTATALLTACGSSNTAGSSDFSSRVTDTTTSTTKSVAYCNQRSANDITAKVKAYTDSSNYVRMDYVYARLTSLPATFKSDSSYISMWKWLANSNGNTQLDNTPLQFIIVHPTTGQALTGWMTTMRWSDVATVASALGVTDPQTFFSAVNILVNLKDTQGEYDVLKVTNYDSSSNKALNALDLLLPAFYANPADYAYETNGSARAGVLKTLHPFANYLNQGYSTSQFVSMANNYCF
ncbi:MAG: hypothetical protein OM95_04080 [Bdellovibrio sp. ArHS]|uniref:hypothetical protein n=1 Tax=Bdellovibrio sp. ArHS TaxID=1569284 RepID=UPI0005831777|nr:hypothetical protein [Bdellovibrio sp. ArHS]KHD89314.1 MAG: hypothetical protein OM95_04080 [Bdellovibrio sp. ArHS]